jgi:hypothetical protein
MVFDDNDLKRLKARGTYQRGNGTGCWIRADNLKALLARLEDGEFLLRYFIEAMPQNICPCCNTDPHIPKCAFAIRLEAWRKACGK